MKDRMNKGITFYVAECTEFPSLGVYKENLSLEEALDIYDSIPEERMHGVKGIGFQLEECGTSFDLMQGDEILTEIINMISDFRDNPLIQKAMEDCQNEIAKRKCFNVR